jgi:hypothetical protein
MRAVTIRQPRATSVLAGRGRRSHPAWQTDHRGPLLIHAAKRVPGDPPDATGGGGPAYGALLGVVELVDCVEAECGGDADEAGYVWVLGNPRRFTHPLPHPDRKAGLFDVPDALVAAAFAEPPAPKRPRRGKLPTRPVHARR